jgi:hypothetical protein
VTTIITKSDDRIDWVKTINAFPSVAAAKRWQMEEYQRCQDGIDGKVHWFKNYVYTIDARKDPSIIPFVLYDYQIDFIKELDKYGDTFVDKSRQMGVSWTMMGWELHNVLYKKGFSALNISRKETEVQDSGNTHHSLHGRLFFMYQRLPVFLKPRIHNPHLTFKVPSMNSVIKGESSNPKAGRDSQYKFVFIDEAAHIDCLDEMWKGVRSASNSICLCSTPPKARMNNKFAEIRDLPNSGFKHISFHWSKHPEYTQEWYRRKTASMTQEEIDQELEISYDGALTNKSYPEFKEDIHLMSHKVYYNKNFQLYCFMDFGLSGEVFEFAQKDGEDRLFFIYCAIYKNKLTPELYKDMLTCLGKIGYQDEVKDIFFIGDKSGTKRDRTSKISVIDEYRTVSNNSIDIKCSMDLVNEVKMKDMKACLKNFINGRPQFNISSDKSCIQLAEAMKLMQLNNTGLDHIDNDLTHFVNAAEYGISYLFPRKKASFSIGCLDPGQEVEDRLTGEKSNIPEIIQHVPSVTAVIGRHRIEHKGVIHVN